MTRRSLLHTAAATLIWPGRAGAASTLAVIVGQATPATNLSRAELKRLFLGDPVTVSGKTLVPFNAPPSSAERQSFERSVFQMSPDQILKEWIDRRIRGIARPPKVAPTLDYLLRLAAVFPGAITYAPLSPLTSAVKVVAVDGKRPGDPGYLLA